MRFKDFIAKVDPQPRPKPKLKPKEWVPGAQYTIINDPRIFTVSRIVPYDRFVNASRTGLRSDRPVVVSVEGDASFQDNCELL